MSECKYYDNMSCNCGKCPTSFSSTAISMGTPPQKNNLTLQELITVLNIHPQESITAQIINKIGNEIYKYKNKIYVCVNGELMILDCKKIIIITDGKNEKKSTPTY